MLVVGCLVFAAAVRAQAAVQVDVVYPQQLQQSQTLRLPGTVQAKQHAQLATLEAGRVERLAVEVGEVVEAGQVLLSLEHRLAELQVTGAAAEVRAAELNRQEAQRLYDEVQRLSVQQVVAKTLIAERAALLAKAEAELARVKANHSIQRERLKRHSLKAPFAGVVAERNVDVGEWVTPQNPVMTLVAQRDLRLVIEIPQQHFHTLQNIQEIPVAVIPDTAGITPMATTLTRLVPVSDVQTRTFTAQIDLPEQATGDWVPGMSATAELTFPNSSQAAIMLPQTAIKRHPDGNSSVFVVENNRAKRLVTPHTEMTGNQVTIYGLPADRAYIVKGVEMLQDGMPVTMNVIAVKQP
ncbi:efflux RND transporter periplasmic adaptor subunit [Marinicella meishanensis]|uniref:efflux RND transporter periplasmic adaptor subunit n=1 Tax=Marinicella meishanensis TaxID=2873263 RepID=UPI001CBB0DA9|nr:efflux RND transporter periplasmic adaptor subunit [Marinicella sp. NBU2979]